MSWRSRSLTVTAPKNQELLPGFAVKAVEFLGE